MALGLDYNQVECTRAVVETPIQAEIRNLKYRIREMDSTIARICEQRAIARVQLVAVKKLEAK